MSEQREQQPRLAQPAEGWGSDNQSKPKKKGKKEFMFSAGDRRRAKLLKQFKKPKER